MTITSTDNQWIKELRKLSSAHGRGKSELFAAEGEDLVELGLASGWQPKVVLVREGLGLEGEDVNAEVLDSVTSLASGCRMVGLFERKYSTPPASGLVVHLAGVKDLGNVGTIIRSAHALGASSVSVGLETGDPFSQRSVRASMGSVFAIPICLDAELGDLPSPVIGLSANGDTRELPGGDMTLVVGAERAGLPPEVEGACDLLWSIPMADGAESLNASVAASIALYSANRIQS